MAPGYRQPALLLCLTHVQVKSFRGIKPTADPERRKNGLGQTLAAHDLCTSLRPYRKRHHMQAGVGHYGVFSGRTWQNQIYPMVKNVILQSD